MGGPSSLWGEHSPVGTQGALEGPGADPGGQDSTSNPVVVPVQLPFTPPWTQRCSPTLGGRGAGGQEGLGSGLR